MNGIDIIPIKQMDVKGAYVIDGFPSVGLVGSIAANYLVSFLELDLIGVLDSMTFPAMSLVREGIPYSPVRIYGGKIGEGGQDKIVVFVSEFQPPPEIIKPLATTLMDWVEVNKCRMVISPEGMILPQGKNEDPGSISDNIFGIGSTQQMTDLLKEHDIPLFETGIIMGLAGVLLNEGVNRDIGVVTILSWAHAEYPDARAAAACISAIDKILLQVELDIKPLITEAEVIEKHLKQLYKTAGKEQEIPKSKSIMYS
ncbi:MAG: proteasome assembly chaperone family protein [Methanomassiliicoccales archaeon]|nr:proteasome assembly chaperone family protein [Methanomassiliicoccales archaeon]NYT15956.1 proteasome assembly chaperone family protein [Methanomassiliicoccales archaeon]